MYFLWGGGGFSKYAYTTPGNSNLLNAFYLGLLVFKILKELLIIIKKVGTYEKFNLHNF